MYWFTLNRVGTVARDTVTEGSIHIALKSPSLHNHPCRSGSEIWFNTCSNEAIADGFQMLVSEETAVLQDRT